MRAFCEAVCEVTGWVCAAVLFIMMIAAWSWAIGVSYGRENPVERYPSVCRPVDWHDGRPDGTACAYFERLGDALDYARTTGDVVRVPPGNYR